MYETLRSTREISAHCVRSVACPPAHSKNEQPTLSGTHRDQFRDHPLDCLDVQTLSHLAGLRKVAFRKGCHEGDSRILER
jgi:hypothetical protein